ncbi:GHKL domain protein [Leptospira inadai serovar Lyme str. 10]|uniref:GHKL domain protein n=2 Tax=Leptospira inadai serovar Lyme TaxID=293084 RepID=V6HEV8_9LEPT|nr:GHKL domain protein [Leptospira inadai serovar Lyme str. 10]
MSKFMSADLIEDFTGRNFLSDPRKNILYIDSDAAYAENLSANFEAEKYGIIYASSVANALENCMQVEPPAIIVDPSFTDIDCIKFLRSLRKLSPGSVFFVNAASDSLDPNISSLPWIHSVLDKGQDIHRLVECISTVLCEKESRLSEFHKKALNEENLVSEVAWLQWKENRRSSESLTIGKNILDNLTHSISQGLGIGSLITRLDLVESFLVRENGRYSVPIDLLDSIFENKDILRDWTDKLEKFRSLFDLAIDKERTHFDAVLSSIRSGITEFEEYAKIKNQQIFFEDRSFDQFVYSHPDFVKFSFRELMVNAMKFSPENSKIHILLYSNRSYISLIVMNDISIGETGISGIPEEYYFKVFEPFFRLNHIYDERFHTLDFGFGIGLNLTQNLARQSDCKVSIYELNDYTGESCSRRVAAELQFPIC